MGAASRQEKRKGQNGWSGREKERGGQGKGTEEGQGEEGRGRKNFAAPQKEKSTPDFADNNITSPKCCEFVAESVAPCRRRRLNKLAR